MSGNQEIRLLLDIVRPEIWMKLLFFVTFDTGIQVTIADI